MAGALGEQGGEGVAVVEVDGDEDGAWDVVLVDVELLEEGAEDWACVEGRFKAGGGLECVSAIGLASHPFAQRLANGWGTQFFGLISVTRLEEVGQVVPEEFAAVDYFSGADVEEIYGEAAGLEVVAEDVGVVVLLGGGDALLFVELVDGGELIAKACGGFKLFGLGGGGHAGGEGAFEFGRAAFQKKLGVADGVRIELGSGEAFHARAEAAMDVVLETGSGMVAGEIDLATGN